MSISRNPSDYDYDCESHAGSRKRERKISLDAMEHIIEEGEAKDSEKGRVNFEGTYSGMTITVVVNPDTNYIVTSYYGTGKTGSALEEARDEATHDSPYRSAWD